jgi:hypothetical protein
MQNYSHAMRSNMSNMNPTPPLPPQARLLLVDHLSGEDPAGCCPCSCCSAR